MIYLQTPLNNDKIKTLKNGDLVYLSGVIYTARDAAHKKMLEHFNGSGEMLLKGEVIYYAGPCPVAEGEIIGSIGPTTSYRMDDYTEIFARYGLIYSIGKGERRKLVMKIIEDNGGIHFDAIGGAGAYYKFTVQKAEVVLFPELGAEAVHRLEVKDFPVIVNK